MTLNEKTSYIKGLIEGFNLNKEKEENKAIYAIVDFLGDITNSISKLEDNVDDIQDELEDINDDIDELAADDDMSYSEDIDDEFSVADDTENDDVYYEIECPSCNTKVCLSENTLADSSISCPSCGNEINVSLDGSCKCENCDCEDCD